MKAGLDANVVDFLPWSNSGILVFTPHLPSATLAASDIVKAILFRKLRIVFSPSSPFYVAGEGPADDDAPRQRAARRGGGRLRGGAPEPRRVPRRPRRVPRPAPRPRAGGPDGRALPGPLRPELLQRRRRGVRHGGEALRREPREHRLGADDADEPRVGREVGRGPPRELPEAARPPRPRATGTPRTRPAARRRSTPSSARRPASPSSRRGRSRSCRSRPAPTRRAPWRASWTP